MFADAGDREPEQNSWGDDNPFTHEDKSSSTPAGGQQPGTGEGAEENPFEQEEVLPSTPAAPSPETGPSGYIPEDAVIEYGYDTGQDFSSPDKGEEGEKDYAVAAEEPAAVEQQPPPPAPAVPDAAAAAPSAPPPLTQESAEPADGLWGNQLDKMFPDDGFDSKGKLDWDAKGPDEVALTEPCPAMPGENEQVGLTEMTAEMQGEGVPDSPSGYVVITPSGRKKGVSPEIAQLLDRTSRRQATVGAFEEEEAAKKRHKAAIFVLIVLFIAATAAAGYLFNQVKKVRTELAGATAKTKQVRENLEAKFKADIEKTNSRNKELDAQLKKTTTDLRAYKDEVEAERDAFTSLRSAKEQLETLTGQLKEETARIPQLKNEIKQKDKNIDTLNSTIRHHRKDIDRLDAGVNSRDLEKEKLEETVAKKDTRIENLTEEIEELKAAIRGPHISLSEVASLRDKVRNMGFRMDSLKKELLTANDTLDRIQRGEGGQDEVNLLRMRLHDKSKDIGERDEQIVKLQYALTRYSSPESVIVAWAESLASGDLGRVMKHYAESNVHRKRWAGSDAEREELTGEFKEFTSSKIELEVLSVTITPQENSAAAKLKLKLTAEGKTKVINATMILVREFERWAILDEGF